MSNIVIFETGDQPVQVWLEGETVWLSQAQMADLFDVQKAAISKHLKNIFVSGELERVATVSKMETVQQEGRRTVSRRVERYNLDAIISVGYWVSSTCATRFRQWATGVLRQDWLAQPVERLINDNTLVALARLVEHFVLLRGSANTEGG